MKNKKIRVKVAIEGLTIRDIIDILALSGMSEVDIIEILTKKVKGKKNVNK